MPYTTPATVVTGTPIASAWGNSVKAAADALANPAAVRAKRTAVQSLTNITQTPIQFNAADVFDTQAMHDTVTNNTRFTVPAGWAGLYLMLGTLRFLSNVTGARAINILLNGTTIVAENEQTASAAGPTTISVQSLYKLAVGDYVELRGYQASGGALNIEVGDPAMPQFSMLWVGLG